MERQKAGFEARYKHNPKKALNKTIKLGYEEHVEIDDAPNYVRQLQNPRKRLLWEIFWLHLPENTFALIKTAGHLTAPSVVRNRI
ncbi:MAG: hypothetical protein ABFS56_21035 [Pseudomonadota bacterium]